MAVLNTDQARDMWSKYVYRRENFVDETEETSFLVVLLNYGDHLTGVRCTHGEWSGTKGDLQSRYGIPHCPNGHPLMESSTQWRLGFVKE